MCYITATELKSNLGKYLELSKTEDIYVTKNNAVITVLVNPKILAFNEIKRMRDEVKVPKDVDLNKILEEEIMKRCGF